MIPKGLKHITGDKKKNLADVFSQIKKAGRGFHSTNKSGKGDDRTSDLRPYQFGDEMDKLALTETFTTIVAWTPIKAKQSTDHGPYIIKYFVRSHSKDRPKVVLLLNFTLLIKYTLLDNLSNDLLHNWGLCNKVCQSVLCRN